MIKASPLISKKLNTLLNDSRKRFHSFAMLATLNIILAISLTTTIKQQSAIKKQTHDLLNTSQSEIDASKRKEKDQLLLNKKIRDTLSNRDDLNGLILSLESTAPAHNITLTDVSQSYVEAGPDSLAHSIIQYNVQGNYSNVMGFVAESLNKHEALALHNLSFRRADPLVTTLQISLEWAYYYQ